MVCCSACGAQVAQGSSFCQGCGRPITAFAMPVPEKKTPWAAVLLLTLFVVGMIAVVTESTNRPVALAAAAVQPNAPETIIGRCGKPDEDSSTSYDKPRPLIVSRIVGYKKQRVKLLYFPKDSAAGAPPPYVWQLVGSTDYVTNKPIQPMEAHKRLTCW